MNVVFLSPHFPPQFFHFCHALKAEGATVLAIGDAHPNTIPTHVHHSLDQYVHVPDMNRYDEVLRAVGGFVMRHGRMDRIESLNEHWLELEARLREDFNVPGPRPADMARNRSKSSMRAVFRAAGVPSSEGERLISTDHAWALAQKFGYPLIFKPDVGVGAARTFRVNDEKEMKAALAEPIAGYVVERFETGPLTSFDGLTGRDGSIVFCTSHKFSSGIMEIVQSRCTMHYYSRREIPPALEELGRKIVKAFGLHERFFHIEMFELENGSYRALEINVRPPGGFTTDMMNYCANIDIYGAWARVLTGHSMDTWSYDRKYFVAHVGRRHGMRYAMSGDDIAAMLGTSLVMQGEMPPVLSAAMGDYFYMFRDEDEESLQESIAAIEETT